MSCYAPIQEYFLEGIRGHTLITLAHRGTQLVSKSEQNSNLVIRPFLVYILTSKNTADTQLVKNGQKRADVIKVWPPTMRRNVCNAVKANINIK